MTTSILKRWDISVAELTELVDTNPSLRGIMLGYVAELQLTKYLCSISGIHFLGKKDDHCRKDKGDCLIEYKGKQFRFEAKSLQTHTVKRTDGHYFGKANVDASDRRPVLLPDGSKLETTCLLRGEFEILAVNCFAFEDKWRFVFAANTDLPSTSWKKYSEFQCQHLLATLVPVTWPPVPPFYDSPIPVLETLLKQS